ncbi:hypothetical protein [Seonamhaeicola sp. ML3]|uniref:hypothetical protein n=1 Tax=Seonamhaeicola sp. ML3 TaxID=2937786 RepID=UPI0020102086|nr:hypothetical protein [Seonamhaeicola sp. ML3]
MKIKIDIELRNICDEIIKKSLPIEQWREIESSDQFQTLNYCGGFDATEDEFCFSFFDKSEKEYWFQLSLNEIERIKEGSISELNIQLAD